MKLRSVIVVLLLLALTVSLFSACGNGAPDSSAAAQDDQGASQQGQQNNVVLTIEASQDARNNFPFAFYQPMIDAFEEQYPHITVKTIFNPDAQNTSVLQTKLAAGQPSDIICYNKVSAENELEAMKNFLDLSNEDWVQNLINPDALAAPDGNIYGFAMQSSSGGYGFVYNADLFDDLGLSIPQTYEELLDTCEAIQATGVTPIYGPFKDVYTFQIWTSSIWGYYGEKMDPTLWDRLNTNQSKWSEIPELLDGLSKGYELFEKGYFQSTVLSDEFSSLPQVFADKQYAMVIASDAQVKDLSEKIPDTTFGLFPIPAYEGESRNLTVGQLNAVFHIPANVANVEAAKQFISFIAQPEQMDLAQEAQAFIPSVEGAQPPSFNQFEQHLYDTFTLPGNTVTEMNAYMQVDLNDLWRYYQDMLAGEKTPEQVLETWDATFSQLMRAKDAPGF